jgi:serine phosphatase RsbU (regulator of sigma subunit)
VSGDFYLITNGPDGSTVAIVGDVVGHGPAAARLATFVRTRFAALAASTSDPAELLALANTALAERPGRGEELVSALCVRFGPERSQICWSRAGHPPPLRLPALAELPHDGSTLLLGAEGRLRLENAEDNLAGGEGLLIYTDGATDVRRGREMLDLEGLRGMLAPLCRLSARAIADELERAILAWADRPIRDDLCLLVVKPEEG